MLVKNKFLLAFVLVHSTVIGIIFGISLTILVMVPVEGVLLGGGAGSHYTLQVNPSAPPHFRFELSVKIHTQTPGVAYLILYSIYSGSTSFT